MTKGIIYTAHGEVWVQRALRSIASVREHMPEMLITVFGKAESRDLFPHVNFIEVNDQLDPRFLKPCVCLLQSPYDKTLYLDADTKVTGDISDLFNILQHYNVALAAQEGIRHIDEVPDSFPEYNGGVILFDNSEKTYNFLKQFSARYIERRQIDKGYDEVALRMALWDTKPCLHTLSVLYNARLDDGKYILTGNEKILHGKNL